MMQTLYLHVGVHRTGTTSTQHFMRTNFNVLLTKGVLYPFKAERHDIQISNMVNGVTNVADFGADLAKRAQRHPHPVHTVVISDEDMSLVRDFNLFAPLKEFFDVKVVVALRRQDLWLESWYLQNIKWQWNPVLAHLDFEGFFQRRGDFFWIDYAERLAHFEDVFGEGKVVAGVFESGDMPDGPIQAFLRMIGVEDLSGFGEFGHSNHSLSPLMSEFMRQLPMDAMAFSEKAATEAACIEVDKALVTNGAKLIMPYAQRLTVMEEYAESNRQTARRHFGREDLFREVLPEPDALMADRNLPPTSAELMEQFVNPVFAALAKVTAAWRVRRDERIRKEESARLSKTV